MYEYIKNSNVYGHRCNSFEDQLKISSRNCKRHCTDAPVGKQGHLRDGKIYKIATYACISIEPHDVHCSIKVVFCQLDKFRHARAEKHWSDSLMLQRLLILDIMAAQSRHWAGSLCILRLPTMSSHEAVGVALAVR